MADKIKIIDKYETQDGLTSLGKDIYLPFTKIGDTINIHIDLPGGETIDLNFSDKAWTDEKQKVKMIKGELLNGFLLWITTSK